jgi:hypothetical protein
MSDWEIAYFWIDLAVRFVTGMGLGLWLAGLHRARRQKEQIEFWKAYVDQLQNEKEAEMRRRGINVIPFNRTSKQWRS